MQLAWNPGFGDGGWNTEGEGYTLVRTASLLQAALAYYNTTGRHVATNRSDSMFLPHYLYLTVLTEQSTDRGERVFHKPVTGVGLTFGQGHDDDERVDGGQTCIAFPLVPARYKPAVAWYWRKWATNSQGQIDARKLGDAAFALVNYPNEMPAPDPTGSLPFVLADRQKGGYIFRKSWAGADDVLALIYYKTRPPGGAWNCAEGGTFRIYGFGRHWAVKCALGNPVITYPYPGKVEENAKDKGEDDPAKGYGNKSGEWRCENVVWVDGTGPVGAAIGGYQSNASAHGGGGIVTWVDQGADFGSVSADMSSLYLRNKMIERGTRHGDIGVKNLFPQNTRDRLGYILRENVEDLGIRATRSFAVDMSGKCGAPALFVVVDRFTESGEKHAKSWRMHLPEGRPKDAAAPDWFRPENCWYHQDPSTIPPMGQWTGRASVVIDGNRFVVSQNGTEARLCGVVVPSAGMKLYHEEKFERLLNIDRKNFVGYSPIIRNAVTIEAESEFFVVMTLGKGEPPKVAIEGSGLGATVTIGQQTVRFEGGKIVFGK